MFKNLPFPAPIAFNRFIASESAFLNHSVPIVIGKTYNITNEILG